MKNLVTKRNITIFAIILILGAWGADKLWYVSYNSMHAVIDPVLALLAALSPLYFLRDEIFRSWLKFIAWWLPFGSLLVYVGLGLSGIPGNPFPAQIFAFTIVAMSLFLFAIKTWELRRAEQENPLTWWVKWPVFVVVFVLSVVLSAYIYGLFW